MENLYPPPPQIKDGKMVRFGFCASSFLIWGGDGGLLFHFFLSKIADADRFILHYHQFFFHINEMKRMSHHGISFAVSSFHPLYIPLSSYLIFPVHRLVPLTFDNEQLPARGQGLARTDSTEWLR